MKKRKLTREELKQRAKNIARGKVEREKIDPEIKDEVMRARALADEYERALGIYRNKSTLKYIKKLLMPSDKDYHIWRDASQIADELEVSYELYIKALFYYAHKMGKRPPKPFELRGKKSHFPAKERVESYLHLVGDGVISDKPVASTVKRAPKYSQGIKDRHSEKVLHSFMKNYNLSEEEILKKFARKETASLFFDLKWLEANTTYQKLRSEGQI